MSMRNRFAYSLVVVALLCPVLTRAQQEGSLTDKEAQIEQRLRPVLQYALQTLSREHTLQEAISYLKKASTTNASLAADLKVLSKTQQDGIRNLSLWCIEAAFPEDEAVWKSILRDGRVVNADQMKEAAGHIAGFIKMGVLEWNAGADMHTLDFETKPAMTVKEFVARYGQPDRRRTLQGTEGGTPSRVHKWFFYGPVGVKVDDSESNVMAYQISLSAVVWLAAIKTYALDFTPMGEMTGNSRLSAERIPDLKSLFLNVGAPPARQTPRK